MAYHEGVAVIRKFLLHASHHTVEELQAFTSGYVPHPKWVHTEDESVPIECIEQAAALMIDQLGPTTIRELGGDTWWQWRASPLSAEWIDTQKNATGRQYSKDGVSRTMLYIHGGAYFFGSVDTLRYQMQRYARELNVRVYARECISY